jgi:hypothetical protein
MGTRYSFLPVKHNQAGRAELYEETRTVKQVVNGGNGDCMEPLGCPPKLSHTLVRITNLIHAERYKMDLNSTHDQEFCSVATSGIMNRCEEGNRLLLGTQSAVKRMQGPKYDKPSPGTAGFPKGAPGGPYGNGVIVVRNRREVGRMTAQIHSVRRLSSTAGQMAIRGSGESTALTQSTGKGGIRLEPNIKAIANIKNLIAAYELIKSNPGNMTRGAADTTLDGINLNYFLKIQELLRAGKYAFPPARRIQIPKPGGKETRPLTIASPRDKIVQKAIQLVLNELYETKFLDSSHGFRPGRGTHTAVRSVDAKFQSVYYIIEALLQSLRQNSTRYADGGVKQRY